MLELKRLFINSNIFRIVIDISPFILIYYQFRKNRQLEVFYRVYESALKSFESINKASLDLGNIVSRVILYQNLLKNQKDETNFMLHRKGEAFNALDSYKEYLEVMEEKWDYIEEHIDEISILRYNFIENGRSYKELGKILDYLNDFMRNTYGDVFELLKYTIDFKKIHRQEYNYLIINEKEEKDFSLLHLDKKEFIEKIQYFNKNNFK